ncbi:SGNH/GDSL hydrolase family protein [Candidatus Mycobacterium methanotrophicum]|uniref:SGNH/GDSL hydrolase family protein n=1 Tax=Candidatus Mycobacterium methanotrophicum TaxID=2943498 RepID=A0ABY4QMF5_9MYCO|nr:SGNH/GDSL hydrolase family protein [Candidatus Mycobacterium methanotrophicum]UQX12192.1 SGNH/GDSL hydrolase family protein [Candidatus Mycobacterium methanotrophicum]
MSARSTLRGARRGIKVAAVAALASTVVGLACYELHSTESPRSQVEAHDVAPPVALKFDHKPILLVVRDSYAVAYPDLVADRMDWTLALDGQDGTGFVSGIDTRNPGRVPFIDRLDGDAATYHVDYVLIDGGRNDLGEPAEPVVAAADEYVKKVRSDWPNAKIVIVLPASATPNENANYPAVADGLRRTAESVGAHVIDPVAQGWYRDIDVKPLLWQDGIHLAGDVGETYYADKITESLKLMGFGS